MMAFAGSSKVIIVYAVPDNQFPHRRRLTALPRIRSPFAPDTERRRYGPYIRCIYIYIYSDRPRAVGNTAHPITGLGILGQPPQLPSFARAFSSKFTGPPPPKKRNATTKRKNTCYRLPALTKPTLHLACGGTVACSTAVKTKSPCSIYPFNNSCTPSPSPLPPPPRQPTSPPSAVLSSIPQLREDSHRPSIALAASFPRETSALYCSPSSITILPGPSVLST